MIPPELVEHWENLLAGRPTQSTCLDCGKPLVRVGRRGPTKQYCGTRCRVAAHAERKRLAGDSYQPMVRYVDAFPPDRARLNAPVQPREGEKQYWAWDVLGSAT